MIAQRIDDDHIGLVMDNDTAEILQALLTRTDGEGAANDRLDKLWRQLKALGFNADDPDGVEFRYDHDNDVFEITGPKE